MKKIIYLLMFIIAIAFVSATNPTQQYNKIYLNSYYFNSLTANTIYNFNISIFPPDRISEVKNAIINFEIYLNPTINLNLTVNNNPCNNPLFQISTTYMTAGKGIVSFDCSNIINKEGNYILSLKSDKNTGSGFGYLDLTYMNNPQGSIDIKGTEYYFGDTATPFLQLKNNQGLPVNNGSCYINVRYPLNSSNQHPYTIQNAPMLKAIGDDGIYYYDLTTPNQAGVYMLSAKCSYTYDIIWIYNQDEVLFSPYRGAVTGSWVGSTITLNNPFDSTYDNCAHAGNLCVANYTFNISAYGSLTNITNINLYWLGQASKTGMTLVFAYWNGTSFINLNNSIALSGTNLADDFQSNLIPLSAIQNNEVIVRLTSSGGAHNLLNNWLSLSVLSTAGTIQDLKGSSEMNVHNVSLISKDVWNFTQRNLTYYQNFSTEQIDLTNYTLINIGVWNYTNRSITYTDNIVSAIWQYTNRTLNYWDNIVSAVWNYTGRYTQGELI